MSENEMNFDPVESKEETLAAEITPAQILEEETPVEQIPVAEEPAAEAAELAEPAPEGKFGKIMEKVKKLGKKGAIIGAAAAVVVLAVILAIVLAGGSSPLSLIATGMQNSLQAMEENKTLTLIDEISNGGSMEVSVDLETLTESMGTGFVLDGSVSAKIYSNMKDNQMVMQAGVKLGADNNLDASMFVNKDSFAVASEWLLGQKAYGFDLKNIGENIKNSPIFGENGTYPIDIELIENLERRLTDSEEFSKDSEKIAKAVAARLVKAIEKHATIEKENATLTFGKEEVATTAVTVELEQEQIYAVVAEMLEYVRDDKALKQYLQDHAAMIFGDMYMDENERNEMIQDFYDELGDMEDELEELAESLELADASCKFTFHITKSGKQLVGVELKAETYDEPVKFSVYAGPDLKEATEISFHLDAGYNNSRISYEVKTDDKKEFEAELKIREDNQIVMRAGIVWDKNDGDFEITAKAEYEGEMILKGNYEQSGKKTTIELKNISVDGERIPLDTTIVLAASDKMPSMPKYNNILQMTEDELEELTADLSEIAQDLIFSLYF